MSDCFRSCRDSGTHCIRAEKAHPSFLQGWHQTIVKSNHCSLSYNVKFWLYLTHSFFLVVDHDAYSHWKQAKKITAQSHTHVRVWSHTNARKTKPNVVQAYYATANSQLQQRWPFVNVHKLNAYNYHTVSQQLPDLAATRSIAITHKR